MTKEEIQKNSEHWYNKYKDAEKRITDLENQIADIKANCDLAIECRDVKIEGLKEQNSYMFDTITLQEQQIEKMKCCYNCSKDCGSIDRRICFENKMKDWVIKGAEND